MSELNLNSDTIQLDTLSLIPNSIFISDAYGRLISDTLYRIDYGKALLIPSKILKESNLGKLKISYRVFPYSFTKPYFHKDIEKVTLAQKNISNPYKITYDQNKKGTFFDKDELNKRGSISRGITFGNNQDVIVNSNLNLQLSGKISENLEILAAITDNNIPIQPDGNSQQLQEFDKVFVQLFNKKTKLIVGDYEITKPAGYYLNLFKKVQGGIITNTFDINKEKNSKLKTTFSGAVSKGKFNKMLFNGIEGNQGPYKLTGAENETYIIVLAGTEKVYIDGRLLKRGQENDYTIDYNTGEVTFTPNQPITKDKRISVEFQYSDKNYARFLVFNSNEFKTKNRKFWVNIFSEQDSKNQPIDITLTDAQKRVLANIGDSLSMAVVPKVDSVAFRNDMVLYKRMDTLVNGNHDTIYVYSTNPDSAHYRLGFSYMGNNRGNYIQVQSSANGRVYKWIAPNAGVTQGNYEPVILLITPKKKQMFTAGGETRLTERTKSNFEFAVSNYDKNTFSTKNKSDDIGYAFKIGVTQDILIHDTVNIKLFSTLNYQMITRAFESIERFRNVEFNRDWNLAQNLKQQYEQQISYNLGFFKKSLGTANYNLDWMTMQNGYRGLKNNVNTLLKYKGFNLALKGSFLNTGDTINKSQFLRHSAALSKQFKYFTLGLKEDAEDNLWKNTKTDSLVKNSYSYSQYEVFITSADTAKTRAFANYKVREDRLPSGNNLKYAMKAEDFCIGTVLQKNLNHSFKTTLNYRELFINDTMLTKNKPENTITGRIEHSLSVSKGVLTTSTFYEVGSGLELKKEFTYVEVAQGQGVYTWSAQTDYNHNGLKELNEFEIANFQNQANYIRVFIPTNQYMKTYTNQFNEVINLKPEKIWGDKTGLKKFIARFSNQFAYRIDRKDMRTDFWKTANPFEKGFDQISNEDTTLISMGSSVRNTFSFNRTNTVFGLDYVYQDNKNKTMLVNGFDTRATMLNGLRIRWNISKQITLLDNIDMGEKKYSSQFFSSKNYRIPYINNEATVSFQPTLSYRISILYKFNDKQNKLNTEKSQGHNAGAEFKYNTVTKGNLTVTINYIKISYKTGDTLLNTNTPVAYEILEGLMPGDNGTWSVQFQRNLTNVLQMSLNYTGRISEGSKAIHTGSVQLRASF